MRQSHKSKANYLNAVKSVKIFVFGFKVLGFIRRTTPVAWEDGFKVSGFTKQINCEADFPSLSIGDELRTAQGADSRLLQRR